VPYANRTELPDSVQNVLPKHAQDIFKDAFNNAYDEYGNDESRAFAVAWGAVKKNYHKNESTGKWEEGASKS
jgi:cation transport regulator